jgi:hypothetical protein
MWYVSSPASKKSEERGLSRAVVRSIATIAVPLQIRRQVLLLLIAQRLTCSQLPQQVSHGRPIGAAHILFLDEALKLLHE